MTAGEKYVAAVYAVVFVTLLVWVAIIAAKLTRLERDLGELADVARSGSRSKAEDG